MAGKLIRIHVAGVALSSSLNVAALISQDLMDHFPESPVETDDLSDARDLGGLALIFQELDSRQYLGQLARTVEDEDTAFIVTHRAIENGEPREVVPGLYRHYKGGEFEVVRVVKDCDLDSENVVFHRVDDPNGQWYSRTLGDFNSMVSGDVASGQDNKIRRFEKV